MLRGFGIPLPSTAHRHSGLRILLPGTVHRHSGLRVLLPGTLHRHSGPRHLYFGLRYRHSGFRHRHPSARVHHPKGCHRHFSLRHPLRDTRVWICGTRVRLRNFRKLQNCDCHLLRGFRLLLFIVLNWLLDKWFRHCGFRVVLRCVAKRAGQMLYLQLQC